MTLIYSFDGLAVIPTAIAHYSFGNSLIKSFQNVSGKQQWCFLAQ